ncbi:hypothetical protein GCM10020331_012950 [Ectobacillus funiculus]
MARTKMMQNNAQTIQQLQEIQSNLNKQMNEIKIDMQTEIKNMRNNVQRQRKQVRTQDFELDEVC